MKIIRLICLMPVFIFAMETPEQEWNVLLADCKESAEKIAASEAELKQKTVSDQRALIWQSLIIGRLFSQKLYELNDKSVPVTPEQKTFLSEWLELDAAKMSEEGKIMSLAEKLGMIQKL